MVYLFGVIGMQGYALMLEEKVDLFGPRRLALGAVVFIVVIGGHIGYTGRFLPIPLLAGIFPNGWLAIATTAVLGILLNGIFNILNGRRD